MPCSGRVPRRSPPARRKLAKDEFIKKLVQEEMDRILADPKYADIIFDKGANELIRTRTHKAVSDAASAAGLDRIARRGR